MSQWDSQDQAQNEAQNEAVSDTMDDQAGAGEGGASGAGEGGASADVLVVVSKLKAYIRAKSGMSTSDKVAGVLSERVRAICDEAIQKAKADGRKTVMDRDI